MATAKFFFILGAPDVEMSAIEAGLANAGYEYAYAAVDGKRVFGGNAYKANGVVGGPDPLDVATAKIVTVECGFPTYLGTIDVIKVDHHQPGDVGYGRPPEDYLAASSIGQVVALLDSTWDQIGAVNHFGGEYRVKLVAASDHCPSHAFAGRCPGIDLQDLIRFRAEEKAAFQKVSVEEMERKITLAADAVRNLPIIVVGGCEVRNAIGQEIDQLPDGSLITGLPVQYRLADPKGEKPTKIGILGGEPDVIAAWMADARNMGMKDVYGDPARGYAGGYPVQ